MNNTREFFFKRVLALNIFKLLRIQSFLPYNSPGAGAEAVLFLKGRSWSRRKSGGSAILEKNYPVSVGWDIGLCVCAFV